MEGGIRLPRSVRWRVQLGILKDPLLDRKLTCNEVSDGNFYLSELCQYNELLVDKQRKRYDELCDKYYRQSCALSIISDMERSSRSSDSQRIASNKNQLLPNPDTSNILQTEYNPNPNTRKPLKAVGDDPLSIMATLEEEKMKIDKMNEMERKKKLVLATRPNLKYHPHKSVATNDRAAKGQISGIGEHSSSGTRTRWNEFHSSKEIMDIINKDLDRLPLNHHKYFHQLKTNERIISDNDDRSTIDDALYMKSRQERSLILSEILFVYAKEHSIGYRQGMHEILSFIMMAIEIDLVTGVASKSLDDTVFKRDTFLTNESKILHDTYTMFDAIMASLSFAFGHIDETSSNKQPLEKTGDATIRIIRDYHGDDGLADFLTSLDVPPELYCTRWIRLMFSREVSSLDNVFKLWDRFLNELGSSNMSLINILETAAASMIILIKDKLLPIQEYYLYHDASVSHATSLNEPPEDSEPMQLLMNYPQMHDLSQMLQVYNVLIANQRNGIKPAKVQRPQFNNQVDNFHYPYRTVHSDFIPGVPNPSNYIQDPFLHDPLNYHTPKDGDQIMAAFKNLQHNPALKKISTSLHAVTGAAKDALLSLDRQMKSQEHPTHTASSRKVISSPDLDPNHGMSFPVYRDLSTVSTVFEDAAPLAMSNNFDTMGIDSATEGHFVNTIGSRREPSVGDQNIPSNTRTLSQQTSEKIKICILKISNSVDRVNIPAFASNDIKDALSQLDAIRRDLESKYDIIPK